MDLLIQCEDLIIPIEEKSGESGSMKSLHQFVEKKRSPLAVRFDLGLPNSKDTVHRLSNEAEKCAEFNLLSLPLYMVEQLPRILQATIV